MAAPSNLPRPREPCHQRLRQLWSACPLRRQQRGTPESSGLHSETPAEPAPPERSEIEEPEERICRYCFEGDEVGELISPCNCSGGQKYVHLSCLRMWQRAVLVSQPTHPDYYGNDSRQRICNVCKSEFTCPPPTRTELMASITGPEIAALIGEGCLIGSAEDFSNDLNQQMAGFPESVRERVVCRNWVQGVFLIVKVVRDRHTDSVVLRLGSQEEVGMLLEQLGDNADSLHLRGRRFTIVPRGPLRHLTADSSPDERREALRALEAPVSLRLRPAQAADCGEDGVIAVNLTRQMDLKIVRSQYASHWNKVLRTAIADVLEIDALESQDKLPFEIAHFIGGPCEEEQASTCLILADGRCMLLQDRNCLRQGIKVAHALSQGLAPPDDADSGTRVWLDELLTWRAGVEAATAGLSEEPAAKRQKQASMEGASHGSDENPTGDASSAAPPSVRLLVLWGYAGWSRCQLMGEIARGSWGLCRATLEDVMNYGPDNLWQAAYPRLIFAPRNEMSESYGGQVPEEEERRRQLRHMAIFHEILHGRLGHRHPPASPPDARAPEAVDASAEDSRDIEDVDDETLERMRAQLDGVDESDDDFGDECISEDVDDEDTDDEEDDDDSSDNAATNSHEEPVANRGSLSEMD